MISNAKKSLLHVARAELQLSEQQYRYILMEHTGMDSCAAPGFTEEDFKKVLDHFILLGFDVKRNFVPGRRDPDELPSPRHLKMLEHVWEDYAQYDHRAHFKKFRMGFHLKLIKVPWPQTRYQCNIVVEAMKTRLKRAQAARRALARDQKSEVGDQIGMGAKEQG